MDSELGATTRELRYAEAQHADTLEATGVDAEDMKRIEAAPAALERAGAQSYTRKHSAGEALEATARIALIGICAAYMAVAVTVIFGGVVMVLALFGLDTIDRPRRRRRSNSGESA